MYVLMLPLPPGDLVPGIQEGDVPVACLKASLHGLAVRAGLYGVALAAVKVGKGHSSDREVEALWRLDARLCTEVR